MRIELKFTGYYSQLQSDCPIIGRQLRLISNALNEGGGKVRRNTEIRTRERVSLSDKRLQG